MLFLFPGSKLWRIAPGYPASHTHTHTHTHTRTDALKSFTHLRPRTTFEKTASDRCPEQKRKLDAKKTSEPRQRASPSPSPPCLRVPSKITSSFCFLMASGPPPEMTTPPTPSCCSSKKVRHLGKFADLLSGSELDEEIDNAPSKYRRQPVSLAEGAHPARPCQTVAKSTNQHFSSSIMNSSFYSFNGSFLSSAVVSLLYMT